MKKLLTILLVLVAMAACTTKKQIVNTYVEKSDSLFQHIDTTYQSGTIDVCIEGDTISLETELKLQGDLFLVTADEYQQFMELLEMKGKDISNPEIVKEIIYKTRGLWSSDTSYLETDFAKSCAGVTNGLPFHTLIQKDTTWNHHEDSLNQVIRHQEKQIHYYKEVTSSTTKIRRLPWYMYFIGLVVALIIILFGIMWIKKKLHF